MKSFWSKMNFWKRFSAFRFVKQAIFHRWYHHLAFLILVGLRFYAAFSHELWRDEAFFMMLARDSQSYPQFLEWLMGDGTPLAPSLLYFLKTLGWDTLFAQQAMYLVFSVLLLAIIFYGFPRLPLWLKVLIGSSYLLMYEYTAITREYGLSALLIGIFFMLEVRCRRPLLWQIPTLFLLTISSSVGLYVGVALFVYAFLAHWKERWWLKLISFPVLALGGWLNISFAWGVIFAGAILGSAMAEGGIGGASGALQAISHIDITAVANNSARFLFNGFLFMPIFTSPHWWHGTSSQLGELFLTNRLISMVVGLATIVFVIWFLWRLSQISIPAVLALITLWGAYLVTFSMWVDFATIRHLGVAVLATFGLIALLRDRIPRIHRRWMGILLGIIMVVQTLSGFFAVYAEGRDTFAQGKNVAQWLKENYPDETPVVFPSTYLPAVAGYLGRPVYDLALGREISFYHGLTLIKEVKAVDERRLGWEVMKSGKRILVTNFAYSQLDEWQRVVVEPLKEFPVAMEGSETFWISLVRPGKGTPSPEGWVDWQRGMKINTSGTEGASYTQADDRLDNDRGSAAEVRMKILNGPTSGLLGCVLSILDGKREGKLSFFSDHIKIFDANEPRAIFRMDTTNDFHTYRFTILKDTMVVFVDGQEVSSVALSVPVTRKEILFGDLGGEEGENVSAQVDYVAYSIGEAITPQVAEELAKLKEVQWEWVRWRGAFIVKTSGTGLATDSKPDDRLNNETGSAAEVRMKVREAPSGGFQGLMLSLLNGKREGKLSFFTDRIEIRDQNDLVDTYHLDTTDDFHTYRIVTVKSVMTVYVDGEEVASIILDNPVTSKAIFFGDFSDAPDEYVSAEVEYVSYSTGEAITPQVVEKVAEVREMQWEWVRWREAFTIKTSGTRIAADSKPDDRLNNETGSAAEVRMKVLEAPASGFQGLMLSLIDGKREGKLTFFSDRIEIRDSNDLKTQYAMNTTDLHAYRITMLRDNLRVYVDGKEIASVTLSNSVTTKAVLFGDYSDAPGENVSAEVEYVSYSTGEAITPKVVETIKKVEIPGEWTKIIAGFPLKTTGTETAPSSYPDERLDNALGSTAEVRMKILQAPTTGSLGLIFSLIDGKREGKLSFFPDRIEIRDGNELRAKHPMDTSNLHTYRFTVLNDTMVAYVDNQEVALIALATSPPGKVILFGDFSGVEGENINAEVEYLAYSVEEATAPEKIGGNP